ncbi:putative ribonuclease H-like domain-containing protein, partial [Tanacetum coccineum]
MNDKMKDPECVTYKVKIAPPDYSKENYLATFTPQKQLNPEQIFCSQDLIKMKEEALKKQTTASRPIKALTVFTPTGLTEGERGFEQTKECYLTEVILFIKTLKEHFEGVQKALTKEMKDIFEELEAEVDQNVVNRKHDEIERKKLLIANDNLIVDCLSKEAFYIATNSEITVSRFTKMHEAHTIIQTRCLKLEAELSKLRNKVQKDDHTELVKRFSNLKVNHLNLQLKYQNLKESFGNDPSPPTRDTPDFDSVFVIEKMKASIQGRTTPTVDFHITQLTEKVIVLQEQNELFRAKNEKVKQHYKELYDSIKITRAKHIEQKTALLTENKNLKAQIHENMKCNTKESVKPRVLAPGRSIISACRYTKHSQELLEYANGICPKAFNQRDKKHAPTPVFFLATKDETSGILKSFIIGIENLVDHKVKVIRCDNGTEFKNREMNQFCEMNGILRQFSLARTPQQNGVAERRNRTLIEAARTMLVDSKLPTTFWAEAVNTACYVQNRVLVVKPHNKTPCELFYGRTPTLSFMRPFRYPVIILNTIDHLAKFDGKADKGFFVGYSLNSKAFRVFNSRTRIVEENLHIRFSENPPNVVGRGPDWLFDIDALTRTMSYEPIVAGTQSNGFAVSQDPKSSHDDGSKPSSDNGKKVDEDPRKESECNDQEKEDNVNNTNNVNAASTNKVNAVGGKTSIELPFDPNMPTMEDYSIIRDDEDVGAEADMNNLDTTIQVSPIPT